MHYINTLQAGDDIKEIFLCKQVQDLQTKAGKNYRSLRLSDKTGDLDGKIWDDNAGIGNFDAMDYIEVTGLIVSFQGNLQLNIRRVRKCQEGEYLLSDYVPSSDRDIEEMYKELCRHITTVKNKYIKEILEFFFVKDEEFIRKFKSSSAAKGVHHAFVGGLLEHTLGVVENCEYFAAHYPVLQHDLVVAAAFFHDIGKTKELSGFPENDYTEDGNLIGHLVMGAEMVGLAADTIPGFPVVVKNELRHCILAHHGELEYGSPKKPAMAEAIALYLADNIDAKMETMKELFASTLTRGTLDNSGEWMGYQRLFESNIKKATKL